MVNFPQLTTNYALWLFTVNIIQQEVFTEHLSTAMVKGKGEGRERGRRGKEEKRGKKEKKKEAEWEERRDGRGQGVEWGRVETS